MTNVPKPTFGPTGYTIPSTGDILFGVLQDFAAAFGSDLNLDQATPQGQLAVSMAAAIDYQNQTFLNMVNQLDPNLASGRFQDAIGRFYFIERIAGTPTTVLCLCGGVPGSILPINALAESSDGNLFRSQSAGIFDSNGQASVIFQAVENGPIGVAPNTLTRIKQSVNGWESITNPTAGILGNYEESREDFEARRENSVAGNSRSTLQSIKAAISLIPNTIDSYVVENTLDTQTTIGGVVIKPHSIYVSVIGGNSIQIATAIWSKKAPGCDYTGSTTQVIEDTEGYSPPYPSYTVLFDYAINQQAVVQVNMSQSSSVPANAVTLIQTAILTFLQTNTFKIGSTIFASSLYGVIMGLGTWAKIISVKINATNRYAKAIITDGSISGNTLTVVSATGTVAIGQTVKGNNVPSGLRIISGSEGTFTLNNSVTATTSNLYTLIADQDSINLNINEYTTLSESDIQVTFNV